MSEDLRKPRAPRAPRPTRSARYRCLVGMDYSGKRAEAGDVVDDLPASSIEWLLRDGHIEEVE